MADETQQISIRIPIDLLSDVGEIAKRQHRDRTKQIIHYLTRGVKDDLRQQSEVALLRRKR